MSLVVAKIVGSNICVVSDTKLSSVHEDIRSKQHPKDGVIKTTILNKHQCISFAGSEYYAEKAFKEMEQGGNVDEMKDILFRHHAFSDYKTEFIFCFFETGPHIVVFKGGQILEYTTAWIGDFEAFTYFQEYYHADRTETPQKGNLSITIVGEAPDIKNIRMTINSKVPNDDFFKMANAMDHVIFNRSVTTVGGFRIQVTFDDEMFSYARYTNISNETLDVIPGQPGRFGWSNAAKGSYNVNCAKGLDNYNYAAIHVKEANLGILYVRERNGLMRPMLYRMDLLDFSDFICEYSLVIFVSEQDRPPKYYNRAKVLFEKGEYFEAIQWICQAIRFTSRLQAAHLYFVLGLSFHNYGRPLSALLCYEHAAGLDPVFQKVLDGHNELLLHIK
jgi:hypothetical protein